MKLHTLFNLDNPACLYCGSDCSISTTSIGYPALSIDQYFCQNKKCKEKYEIHHINDVCYGFSFTCNDLRVFHLYEVSQFGVAKREADHQVKVGKDNYVWMPYFNVDFNFKEELYNKLKLYVLFS